ncbi:DUF4387 domain-containing protein [Deltaproteobacteria bacterium OttesenSCG-928-M10]|nr:DUF4387 domain-containing protein [Deltaproteobacteria bacterium OttesenSCG-928-M10]
MQYNLADLAAVVRSKNSGPYEITFDIIFKEEEMFRQVAGAGIINREGFAALYHIKPRDVLSVVEFPPAKAIKVTIARPISSGSLGETDVYGAQQHGPLLGFTFDM